MVFPLFTMNEFEIKIKLLERTECNELYSTKQTTIRDRGNWFTKANMSDDEWVCEDAPLELNWIII